MSLMVVAVVWVVLVVLFVGVGYGARWLHVKVKQHRAIRVLRIDRDKGDLRLDLVRPDSDGEIRLKKGMGQSPAPILTDGGKAYTWEGFDRAYVVDDETLQALAEIDSDRPGLETPDNAWTLQQRAQGVAERNVREGDLDGLAAFVGQFGPAILVIVAVFVVIVIPAILLFMMQGAGG